MSGLQEWMKPQDRRGVGRKAALGESARGLRPKHRERVCMCARARVRVLRGVRAKAGAGRMSNEQWWEN